MVHIINFEGIRKEIDANKGEEMTDEEVSELCAKVVTYGMNAEIDVENAPRIATLVEKLCDGEFKDKFRAVLESEEQKRQNPES